MSRTVRLITAVLAALAVVFASVFVGTAPAQAADVTVTMTPSATTVPSRTPVTYTVSINCSGAGGCQDTVLTFPTNTITGNGANNDIGSWFSQSSCGFVTRTVGGGLVTYNYGDLGTGIQNCTITVTSPEYTTLNNAVATLTPTVSGSTFATVTGAPVTLTSTAGHNVSLNVFGTPQVLEGAQVTYTLRLICGENRQYDGDIGINHVLVTAELPSNFIYSSFSTGNARPASVTVTAPAVGSHGGTFTYEDATGATCGNPPLNVSNAMDIFVRGVIDGPVDTQACLSGDAEFTYIDGVPGSSSSTTPNCPTVVEIETVVAKGSTSTSLANVGQYPAPGGGQYTYPGNWDQSGGPVTFALTARTDPAANNANIAYLINDPMPCLDNLVGTAYLGNAVGDLCQNPAFIPTKITATGFTPVTANEIVLHYADGTTGNIAFAGGQWTLPNPAPGGGVAEVEFPAFSTEGANAGTIQFSMSGWASPDAVPGNMLRNVSYTDPYLIGQPDPLRTDQSATANVWIADPSTDAGESGRTTLYPNITTAALANCAVNVTWNNRNFLEITQAPSQAVYFDYLAPVGATITTNAAHTFQFFGMGNGLTFTSATITPVAIPDYNGTGRTLYSWTIPAGLITVPGQYRVAQSNMIVALGPGCAGTYNSDMTMGYGTQVFKCLYNPGSSPRVENPPMLPKLNGDLSTNSGPIEDNFCGFSSRTIFEAQNEGYVLNKTVQGNLDPAPAAPGTNGRVSPEGGEATYTISFRNSGGANLTDPVMYDLLPAVGDTIASGATPRDSDFGVELLSMGTLPADLSVEYSTAANPCRPELLTDPTCVDDWSATAPADLGDTTALRFSYDGTIFVVGGAGSNGFQMQYTVSTPATDNGDVAWNSVGTNVFAGDDLMGASESTLVGLEAADAPLLVTKSADVTSYDAVGDSIEYTFTVSNDSGVTLTDVTLTDAFTDAAAGSVAPTVSCIELTAPAGVCSGDSTDLAVGQSATFTATYTVTQADIDHGGITDQAEVSGLPPTGGALEGSSNAVIVAAEQSAALSLLKEADPTTVDAVGDTVDYTFTVENTGNVTVTDLVIDETDFSGTGIPLSIDCPTAPLAPGDEVECTATYAVTQADVDAGSLTNIAIATGTAPAGSVSSETSEATVLIDQAPSLDFTKTATPEEVSSVGQTITYSFLVTNDGNVTISGIAIDETDFSGVGALSAIDCPVSTLAPGDDVTCSATYAVQQADLDAGSISNSASAVGNDPAGTPIPAPPTSDFTVDALSLPAISLDKSADLEASEAGATVTYTFIVTNEGNVALSGVDVTDPMSGLSTIGFDWAGTPGDLPAGESVTGTATYTVTQDDLDAGTLDNSATAVGTPATGDDVTDIDDATVTFVQNPQLSMTKTGELTDPDGIDIGSVVTFDFEITNTGNVTVENVDIDDDLAGLSGITFGTWPDDTGVLEPGEIVTATATYELTSDDLEAGSVINVASATGDAPGGDPSFETSATVPLELSPAITIDKVGTLDTTGAPVAGDTITFGFTVENTGNVPVTDVVIDDELEGLGAIDYTWPGATDGRIGSGETMTATATYTLTQDDIDAGSVVNTATANGDAPGDDTVTATDVEQVDLLADPSVALTKISDFDSDKPMAGDEVTFDFTVENNGNVTVTGIDIADGLAGLSGITFGAWPGDDGELAPGESVAATATYELTQEDIDSGAVENEATASGNAVRGGAVSDDADVEVALAQVSELELTKSADRGDAHIGDVIEYTIQGTNTGNTTLRELLISDELPDLSALEFEWPGDEGVLAPGEAVTVTATYTVDRGDALNGEVVNVATAAALTLGQSTVTATADASVVISPPDTPLALTGTQGTLLVGWIGLTLLGGGLAILLSVRIRRRAA